MLILKNNFTFLRILVACVLLSSCGKQNQKKEVALYNTQCASCHIAPEIDQLPKHIWETEILPRMAARMGIRNQGFDPKSGLPYAEQAAVLKSGIYPVRPTISNEDWKLLHDYIIAMAPDSLAPIPHRETLPLQKFKTRTLSVDRSPTALFTFLDFDETTSRLRLGTISGNLMEYDFIEDTTTIRQQFNIPIVDYYESDSIAYTTLVGKLDPSELVSGTIVRTKANDGLEVATQLHRPVHSLVQDLNDDGSEELVVSEFGHLTGQLSLLSKNTGGTYEKTVLLGQPGMLRTIAKDMNADGKLDLIVASSQGDEGVWILYQEDDLKFSPNKVVRFSPVYGTSWFELVDYDGDGDQDIITVQGDNADYSYVPKPYHGVRIHLNDGNNVFEHAYFYPMHGATRILAEDFDADNDIDLAVVATFPDYKERPLQSFTYLENNGGEAPNFTTYSIDEVEYGRWFLMDSGDVDGDGDKDIIVSAFSYAFTPTSDEMEALWLEKQIDLLVLENQLNK
ncbi:VCBS repeat-containing protein [bacterium]|nr:VCBS repeat-containing protein [bacterium]